MSFNDRRIEYGYAGMDRDQAYRAYVALTCSIPLSDHNDRVAVLKEIMAENFEQENDVDLVTAGTAAALAPQINDLDAKIASIDAAIAGSGIVGPGQIAVTVSGTKTMLDIVTLSQAESHIILLGMRGVLQLRRNALSDQLTALA